MGKYRVSTPATSAGVMRFMDVKASAVELDPQQVLVAAVAFVVAVSIARMMFG